MTMQNLSRYMVWKLECDTCAFTCSPLAWDYDLPRTCQCGGLLLIVGDGRSTRDSAHNTYKTSTKDRDVIENELNEVNNV